jgi:uncharacterized membrane protein
MKKIAAFAFFFTFVVGTFASLSPASADKHKQNFQQQRCNGNSCR